MLEGRRISYEEDGDCPPPSPPKAGETPRTLMMGISEGHSKSEQQPQPDEKQQIHVEKLRKRSRQEYLKTREKKKLEQLINDVQDQEYLFQGVDLTSDQRLKRQICDLDLVGKKIDCSKEYRIPESYDGNRRKGFDAALQRYTDSDSDPAWEEHQFGKAIMKHQKKNFDYELVFEHQIDSVKTELIDSGDGIEEESPLPELESERKSLPIYAYKEQLMKAVHDHQVLVIVGETGSGKTTQIPQFLDEAGYTRRGMIGCTQPRRVAAMSVAARVAREKGVKLGHEVGYSIRFEDRTSKKTVLKYMTDGRLLHEFRQQLRKEPILASYSVIMVDEAHERTVNTDILFSLLKDVARARPDFKLLISSATLDAIKFSDYFDSAPIFTIPGRKFPVEILYTRAPEPDYLAAAVATALQIHATEEAGDGDILVFLTGQEEIEAAEVIVSENIKKVGAKMAELIICPIYANLPPEVQARVFAPTPKGARKLVLATNIAETSLTIDGIKYVVDCGFAKMKSYSPRVGMESLVVEPITRASANQRAGRSGRTGPGKCFRLYTAYTFANELDENIVPEIQRTNLGNVVLTLKSHGVDDLLHFDFMDPPPAEALVKALELLYALGALNMRGELTRVGEVMSEFPLDPMLSKMIVASEKYGCCDEIISISCMLSVGNSIFCRPKGKEILADNARRSFHMGDVGDHIAFLNVYNFWKENNFSSQWCYENYVQGRSMRRARDIRDQLERLVARAGIPLLSNVNDLDAIKKAIASGFFPHSARLQKHGDGYVTVKHKQNACIHPSSGLAEVCPRWVMYHELVLTTKEFMRQVTELKPEWLLEVAPHYYKVEEIYRLYVEKQRAHCKNRARLNKQDCLALKRTTMLSVI